MLTKGRILVVDNEEIVREVVTAALTGVGYRVCCVADGSEGVVRYKVAIDSNDSYDAVLLEEKLPGSLSGLDAAQAIMALDPGARVLISSGIGMHREEDLNAYGKLGFAGMLPKPYGMCELVEVVGSLLAGKADREA